MVAIGGVPSSGTGPPDEPPPLIPRAVLFGNPARAGPQLSPDGRFLTYLAPDAGNVLQVWLCPLGAAGTGGQPDARVLTADRKRGIRTYFWSYLPGRLLYAQDADGDENFHLYLVDVEAGSVRDVTPFPDIQARLVGASPDRPGEILVGLNLQDRRRHDVYRVDLRSGATELVCPNPGTVTAWTADAALGVRAATAGTPDGGTDLLLRDAPESPWRLVRHWGPDDGGHAVGFSRDGATLYVVGSHDANTRRLLAVEAATGAERVLADDPRFDVGWVTRHPTQRTVQAVAFQRERLEWKVLDPDVRADFEALAAVRPGELRILSRDLADETWLVSSVPDDGPTHFYAYRRASRQATLLFTNRPNLEGLRLARMEPIAYQARDGLPISGYLTVPVGAPAQGLPAVVLVHGGPWGRDTWGFHPQVQWLANRGYAVLQVNFRGSAGYGKAFLNAGDREWGGRMHDDVVDGVRWLVRRGTADPQRIGIMGGSYGGYATLAGLAFTPEVFACGVDLVGPSNIVSLINSIPPHWTPIRARLIKRMGDPEGDQAFLESRSPLFSAGRIAAPLLIGQGANDPRVPQRESDQIAAAVRANGKPVEYLVYGDEGHGFARPENNRHFFARAEAFLAAHLGGRCEPADDVAGHSGTDR
jgi:dipeptidyl aminopeptidase/acylaminoacyl peptidase